MTKRNKTLEEILDVIFYNNPSTQDEIAEELGISRRYVTKLLKPLIDQDIVKRAYILDMDKLEETYGSMNGSFNSKEHSANFLIQNMIKNMAKHVGKQVELSFEAVLENDKQIAEDALEMDFTTWQWPTARGRTPGRGTLPAHASTRYPSGRSCRGCERGTGRERLRGRSW